MEKKKANRKNNDSVEFEIAFYENILRKRPNFIECLKTLAELYTKVGRHHEGLVLDERLSGLMPGDETVFYNLACSYSLTGHIEKSLEAIKKAIKLGFNDFDFIKNDPDLMNLRKDKRFQEILSRDFLDG